MRRNFGSDSGTGASLEAGAVRSHPLCGPRTPTWVLVTVIIGVPLLYPLLATGLNLLPRAWLKSVTDVVPTFAILHLLAFAVVICGWVVGLGGQRFRDLGLRREHLGFGLAVMAAVWCVSQIVLGLFAWFASGTAALHPVWAEKGAAPLALFAGNLLATALFEEVTFRGFVLPQLYQRLQRPTVTTDRWRLLLALVLSGGCFAVAHLPVFLLQKLPLEKVLAVCAMLTLAGVFGGVLYLRTRNLFAVIGVHALYNSPVPVVDCSPTLASAVVLALGILLMAIGPRLAPASSGDVAGCNDHAA